MSNIPRQRGAGQRGGSGGQRANRGTFRNAGGSVPPKKGGCLSILVPVVLGLGSAAAYGIQQLF